MYRISAILSKLCKFYQKISILSFSIYFERNVNEFSIILSISFFYFLSIFFSIFYHFCPICFIIITVLQYLNKKDLGRITKLWWARSFFKLGHFLINSRKNYWTRVQKGTPLRNTFWKKGRTLFNSQEHGQNSPIFNSQEQGQKGPIFS